MTKEEMIARIAELEKQNRDLIEQKRIEKEIADAQIFELNKKYNEVLEKLAIYQEKYKIERTKTFIPKSEKLEKVVINEIEETIVEAKKSKKTNKGKKYKKKFDYEKYVTEIRYIKPIETICPNCNANLIVANEKTRYVVEVIPAKIKVIKLIKQNYKCPNCNSKSNKLFYAFSNEVFGNSICTPSFAAHILYNKYDLGIPFNHLQSHFKEHVGFDISKQDLSNYMRITANKLDFIYDKMKYDLLNSESKVIHSDETTLVVNEKDSTKEKRKKSYVYAYTSSFYDSKQIRIYSFNNSRSIDKTADWLSSFDGTIICDAFSGYEKLIKINPQIKLQNCWAHVRRKFADILKNNMTNKKDSISYQILEQIKSLFYLEKKYKDLKLIPSKIASNRKTICYKLREK